MFLKSVKNNSRVYTKAFYFDPNFAALPKILPRLCQLLK